MKAIYTESINKAKKERDTKNATLFKEFEKNIKLDDDEIDNEIIVFIKEAKKIENEFENQENQFKKTYIESFNIQIKKSFPENELNLYIDETESLSNRCNLVLKTLQASLADKSLSQDEQNKATLQITNLQAKIYEFDNTLQELEENKEDINEWKDNVTAIVLKKITSRQELIKNATQLITEQIDYFEKLQNLNTSTDLSVQNIANLHEELESIKEGEKCILDEYFITPLTGVAQAEEADKQCYHAMQQLARKSKDRSIEDYSKYSYESMLNTFDAIQDNALAAKAFAEKESFKAKHNNILSEHKVLQKQKTGWRTHLPGFFTSKQARNQQIQNLQAAVNSLTNDSPQKNMAELQNLINTQSEALTKETRLWGRESAFEKVLSKLHQDLGKLLYKSPPAPLPHEPPKTPTPKKPNR